MGDILDDFIQISKEFGAIKDDFAATKDQMLAAIPGQEGTAAKHEVTQIWDPARYLSEPSIDYRLCTHTAAAAGLAAQAAAAQTDEKDANAAVSDVTAAGMHAAEGKALTGGAAANTATAVVPAGLVGSRTAALIADAARSSCRACVDACPTGALSIDKGSVRVSSADCNGCNLCVAACPTEALVSTRLDAKELYDSLAAGASVKEASYATCANALAKTPPDGIAVLPCIGAVKPEIWFALLAAYPNIAIYLPLDACEGCVNSRGEEMYCTAIERAEAWSGRNMGFECELADLKLGKRHDVERRELVNKIVKSTVTGVSTVNPLASGAMRAYEAINKNTQLFDTVQLTLNRLCGVAPGEEVVRTLTPARKLMLAALGAHKGLAVNIELELCVTRDACTACGTCIATCPTGARVKLDGEVKTIASYCMGCGLCTEVCPVGACALELTNGCVFVGETVEEGPSPLEEPPAQEEPIEFAEATEQDGQPIQKA